MKIVVEAQSSNPPIECALVDADDNIIRDWQAGNDLGDFIGLEFDGLGFGEYRVKARDAINATDTEAVTVGDVIVPDVPNPIVEVSNITREGFTLTYQYATDEQSPIRYHLYLSEDPINSVEDTEDMQHAGRNDNDNEFTVTGYQPGDKVHYFITATDPSGNVAGYEAGSQVTADLEIISVEVV